MLRRCFVHGDEDVVLLFYYSLIIIHVKWIAQEICYLLSFCVCGHCLLLSFLHSCVLVNVH